MVAAQLPHLRWSDEQPPICSFYSFAAVERPSAEEEFGAAGQAAEEAEAESEDVAAAPPVSKPVPAALAHSASAPPSFQIKASAVGKTD